MRFSHSPPHWGLVGWDALQNGTTQPCPKLPPAPFLPTLGLFFLWPHSTGSWEPHNHAKIRPAVTLVASLTWKSPLAPLMLHSWWLPPLAGCCPCCHPCSGLAQCSMLSPVMSWHPKTPQIPLVVMPCTMLKGQHPVRGHQRNTQKGRRRHRGEGGGHQTHRSASPRDMGMAHTIPNHIPLPGSRMGQQKQQQHHHLHRSNEPNPPTHRNPEWPQSVPISGGCCPVVPTASPPLGSLQGPGLPPKALGPW